MFSLVFFFFFFFPLVWSFKTWSAWSVLFCLREKCSCPHAASDQLMVRWAQQYHNWPAKVQVEWNKNPGVRGCLTAAHHSCVTLLMDYRRRRRSSFNTHASSSRSKNLSVVPEGAAVEITDGCLIMWLLSKKKKKNALRRSTYNQIFSRQVSRSKTFLAHSDWKFKFSLKFFYLRWFRRISALIWLYIFADWISGKTCVSLCARNVTLEQLTCSLFASETVEVSGGKLSVDYWMAGDF